MRSALKGGLVTSPITWARHLILNSHPAVSQPCSWDTMCSLANARSMWAHRGSSEILTSLAQHIHPMVHLSACPKWNFFRSTACTMVAHSVLAVA